MSDEETYRKARTVFARSAACLTDETALLPEDPFSRMQIEVYRWSQRKLAPEGQSMSMLNTLGVGEEVGELAGSFLALVAASGRLSHIALKSAQKIRGYDDPEKARVGVADALADVCIFATQIATTFGLDFGVLYTETLNKVLRRDWEQNPQTGASVTELPLRASHSYDADGAPTDRHLLDEHYQAPQERAVVSSNRCVQCGAAHPELVFCPT